jgi:hypothetical protein
MAVTVDTTINVKQTIQIIIQKVTRSNGAGRLNHFAIRANENGVEVLLYVKSVRLNFEDASVLIDAAVFVLTGSQGNISILGPWAQDPILNGQMHVIEVR